jgi:hypothetical protein
MDALLKEMGALVVAFEMLEHGKKGPAGWFKSTGHIVWDVNMDFTCKAQWVKDGHKTTDTTTSSFTGVVSRESIRIALIYADMLGLPVIGGNIKNAYLQAPSSEKHFIVWGPEFGVEKLGEWPCFVEHFMAAKLLEGTFGITSKNVWHVWVSRHLVQTRMFGSNCQRDQQGRNTTSMYCSTLTMS